MAPLGQPGGLFRRRCRSPDVGAFLRQLDVVVAVRCDEATLRVGGLSLAAWNALLSAGLALAAALGWLGATRGS